MGCLSFFKIGAMWKEASLKALNLFRDNLSQKVSMRYKL